MRIRTPLEFGLVIREKRRQRELSQAELARKVGVSRQWIVGVERGKSRSELGLVLQTLNVLDISLSVDVERPRPASDATIEPVDIDAVIEAAKRR
jgi:HTH-type transcriptional regulator/antitoxin HipB